jgi:hypothetical protein
MTLVLTKTELALCYIYDFVLNTIYIKDLIYIAKNSVYVKNKLSDYVIKIILYTRDIGDILA